MKKYLLDHIQEFVHSALHCCQNNPKIWKTNNGANCKNKIYVKKIIRKQFRWENQLNQINRFERLIMWS